MQALGLELKFRHNAPRVRTSLVVLSFTKTPLFKGETNQIHFLFPLLNVETVAEEIFDTLYSGRGRTIFLPGILGYLSGLVSALLLYFSHSMQTRHLELTLILAWCSRMGAQFRPFSDAGFKGGFQGSTEGRSHYWQIITVIGHN